MSVDILVLTHEQDRATADSSATINILANLWRQRGLTVSFQTGLSRSARMEAAVAINHVDLTVTPRRYATFLARFPKTINGGLTDISKTRYCRDLLRSADAHDGPVIVKTNLNYGGIKEHRVLQRKRRRRQRYLGPLSHLWGDESDEITPPWHRVSRLEPAAYPIYDHASLVPTGVWRNRNLIVQRFLPERDDRGLYLLRSWYLLGDRGFHVVTVANEPIVKGSNIIERRVVEMDTPAELATLRKAMRVDYGRFDYAMVDGKPVVYDINRTPTSSAAAVAHYVPQWSQLAEGIKAFLDSPQASRS